MTRPSNPVVGGNESIVDAVRAVLGWCPGRDVDRWTAVVASNVPRMIGEEVVARVASISRDADLAKRVNDYRRQSLHTLPPIPLNKLVFRDGVAVPFDSHMMRIQGEVSEGSVPRAADAIVYLLSAFVLSGVDIVPELRDAIDRMVRGVEKVQERMLDDVG